MCPLGCYITCFTGIYIIELITLLQTDIKVRTILLVQFQYLHESFKCEYTLRLPITILSAKNKNIFTAKEQWKTRCKQLFK